MIPKIIALDIDGTLFDSNGVISDRNLRAIKKCTQKGIQVVLATGRDYDALPLTQIDGTGIKYVVGTNGSCIYELWTRRCIWEKVMKKQDILSALEYINERDIFPYLFIDGRGYAQRDKSDIYERICWPKHLKDETRANIHYVEDLSGFVKKSDRGVQKGAVLFPRKNDYDGFPDITKLIGWNETYAYIDSISGIHAVNGGCENLEFVHEDATKATGLLNFAKMINISMNEILAMGDSENDIEMLQAAGCGVAMANAKDHVRAAADDVTLSNDEDGVAAVLERFV